MTLRSNTGANMLCIYAGARGANGAFGFAQLVGINHTDVSLNSLTKHISFRTLSPRLFRWVTLSETTLAIQFRSQCCDRADAF
ncbi:hypothetical protein Q31a_36520 [Aureliella helgolandensis]|uniref:Uncharacterized protein n=1 Tax=Aureliella helgolandensis TaxID=2527968 RepID=A0A518G9Q3_9BACT|nr:hypothetical protein Q31a_36520 [Aureliella helgolandensis]